MENLYIKHVQKIVNKIYKYFDCIIDTVNDNIKYALRDDNLHKEGNRDLHIGLYDQLVEIKKMKKEAAEYLDITTNTKKLKSSYYAYKYCKTRGNFINYDEFYAGIDMSDLDENYLKCCFYIILVKISKFNRHAENFLKFMKGEKFNCF